MAGNADIPDVPNPPVTKPRVKMFACPNCGGSITLRYPGASMSVVCENCQSIIDVNDENYKILTKFFKQAKPFTPLIPLGQRGSLKGKTWEVIGFMARSDVNSAYFWTEYLLFNPYYGYRWLVEDKGHWNFITTIKKKPESNLRVAGIGVMGEVLTLDGKRYKVFNSGRTQVDYVIGEFYWRVVIGSQTNTADYIDPPFMLSCEKDASEVVWSTGEYISHKEIKKAFKLDKVPDPIGTAATEPPRAKKSWGKMGMLWALFLAFITCAQIWLSGTSPYEVACDYRGIYLQNGKQNDQTTPVFTLEKEKSNVQITVHAPVSNSWFYISGELVNNTTGATYPFERTVEYYYGTDSDGAWTEGSSESALTISAVPGGKYYLNLDTESGGYATKYKDQYNLKVVRGVPLYDNYFWFAFFLSILPLVSWSTMRQEEASRWANSDFNPYVSSSE